MCAALAGHAAAGDTTSVQTLPLGDVVKNGSTLSVTARLTGESGIIQWTTAAEGLAGPLGSAEFAVLQAGLNGRKAEQGRSMPGRVILGVDLSRYGAAWLRPAHVWAQMLTRAMQNSPFATGYPFAAVALLQQSLTDPGLTAAGVATHPETPAGTHRETENLCETLGWAHS
ncbi:hypothetical protein ACFYYM_07635 [Streptomyces erythrochromogenes]|uniref:hypothetical protein n=1 Tax=Streptomyces erythrochromogenes TaxID=285574 RepID=UPI0036947B85